MALIEPRNASMTRTRAELWSALGMALTLAFFLISGTIAYRNIETLRTSSQQIWHTHEVLVALDDLLSTTQDAETGQRGYLLTGNDRYLEPYNGPGERRLAQRSVVALTKDNAVAAGGTWSSSSATSTPSWPS
jgi:CHASE3 domain sensor protein